MWHQTRERRPTSRRDRVRKGGTHTQRERGWNCIRRYKATVDDNTWTEVIGLCITMLYYYSFIGMLVHTWASVWWTIWRCSRFHSRYHSQQKWAERVVPKTEGKKQQQKSTAHIRASPTHDYNFNRNHLIHINNMEWMRFVRGCAENCRGIDVRNFTRIFMRIMSTHS